MPVYDNAVMVALLLPPRTLSTTNRRVRYAVVPNNRFNDERREMCGAVTLVRLVRLRQFFTIYVPDMAATMERPNKRCKMIKCGHGSTMPIRKSRLHGYVPEVELYDSCVYACKGCKTRQCRGGFHFTERGWDVYRAAEIRRRHKIDFSPEQFNWAVKRWNSTCFLTGKTREQGGGAPSESSSPSFTLIHADPSEGFSEKNSVLCCHSLARELAWRLPAHLLASYKAIIADESKDGVVGAAKEVGPEGVPVATSLQSGPYQH